MHPLSRLVLPALALAGLVSFPAAAQVISWNVTSNGTWDTVTEIWTGDATTYSEGADATLVLGGSTNYTVTIDRDADGVGTGVDDVSPGSTIFNITSSARTLTVSGGRIQSGTVTKTGPGTVTFQTYPDSFSFTGLTVNQGRVNVRDLNSSIYPNGSSFSFGTGPITLNGGSFGFLHSQGGDPGVTLTNDLVITAAGGEINTARANSNPRTVFAGNVTLGGDLLLSAGSGGNNEPTANYTGTITLTGGNRAIRGASNFGNGKYPAISGTITEDVPGRQLTLRMETPFSAPLRGQFQIAGAGNSYSGGTVIESGAGFIRVVGSGRLGTGDVTIEDGGDLRLENNLAIFNTATLSITNTISLKTVALDYASADPGNPDSSDMQIAGLILNGVAQPDGVYSAATHPDFFSGSGEIVVGTPAPNTPPSIAFDPAPPTPLIIRPGFTKSFGFDVSDPEGGSIDILTANLGGGTSVVSFTSPLSGPVGARTVPVTGVTTGSAITLEFTARDSALALSMPVSSTVAVTNIADIDEDGDVDATDINTIVAAFGLTVSDPADLNADNQVDLLDIATGLANLGFVLP